MIGRTKWGHVFRGAASTRLVPLSRHLHALLFGHCSAFGNYDVAVHMFVIARSRASSRRTNKGGHLATDDARI